MTKYAGLAMAVEGHLEKKAAGNAAQTAKIIGRVGTGLGAGLGALSMPSEHADLNLNDPVARTSWYNFNPMTSEGLSNLGNLGDWTLGWIPGVQTVWSLGRAVNSAVRGDWTNAGIHALGAIPVAGRGLSIAAKGARAAQFAAKAGKAGRAARTVAGMANAGGRAAAALGKVPVAGAVARNPAAVGRTIRTGADLYRGWYGIGYAHKRDSDRRANEAMQAQQQQPGFKPVTPRNISF